jgi:hypothetical protein
MKNLLLLFVLFVTACSPVKKYYETAKSWEPEIQKLEQKDKEEKDPENAILYIGSSSIRLWKNIDKDMAPYPAIQRGYGGARFTDLIYYTDRIVYPHKFRALVVFVANDISGSDQDKTPAEVLDLYKGVVKIVRKKFKKEPIYFIGITPVNSRWATWPKAREANRLIREWSESTPNQFYIDTEAAYLNAEGKPRAELFIGDQLHQNQKGYDLWSSIIKKKLDETLK